MRDADNVDEAFRGGGSKAIFSDAHKYSPRQSKRRAVMLRLRHALLLAEGALLLLLPGCAALSHGFLLSPAGVIAQAEQHEFIVVGIILLFVFFPVAILLPLIAWHYRLSNTESAFRPQWGFSWYLEALIWVPPTLIVGGLSLLLVRHTVKLDPYRPLPASNSALQIEVVSLDWKWLFIYPAQDIATVNEVVVPVGKPVHFLMTSGTVMNSMLMPRLAGQIFLMAGMQTQLNFNAQKLGTYMGENTQYSGMHFSEDRFHVRAVTQHDFTKWMAQAQANPAKLDISRYQNLSRQSVIPHPLVFGRVAKGLYKKILSQTITEGHVIQQHLANEHE